MADDTIVLDAISRPKKVTTDAGSVEQFGIDEAIKAEQYLASKRRLGTGLKFHRIIPPGAAD